MTTLPNRLRCLLFGLALNLPAAAFAADDCNNLDCLLCPAIQDPASYAEGAMKLTRQITPGKDHWLFRSEVDLTSHFGIPRNMQPEFGRLVKAFADQGTHLVTIIQPTRGLMHRDKLRSPDQMGFDFDRARGNLAAYLKQLRQAGALVPDVLQLVDHPPEEEYFFRRDHHWTPAGARATAALVAQTVRQLPDYAALPHGAFANETGITLFKDGTLNQALYRLCGNHYGFQYVQGYQTVQDLDDESALFGDLPSPEVVLVGTSNSAARDTDNKQFNFDGFLKEYLQTDLINMALPGAGEYGALVEYLHSDLYREEGPPELILWELPANYRLESPEMYRQLVPAIQGQCKAPRTAMKRTLKNVGLHSNRRIELLSNTGDDHQDLRDFSGYIDLRISDQTVKQFYLIVYYDNGQRDKVWIRREAIVSGGQYYLELSRQPQLRSANILSVLIEPTETAPANTDLEVLLCASD